MAEGGQSCHTSPCGQDEGVWVTLMEGLEPGGDLMEFVIPKVYSKGKLDWWRPPPWGHSFS